jgi:hypothetical protein
MWAYSEYIFSKAKLSKAGEDFLFNKLLNTDPEGRFKLGEKSDYLGDLDDEKPIEIDIPKEQKISN